MKNRSTAAINKNAEQRRKRTTGCATRVCVWEWERDNMEKGKEKKTVVSIAPNRFSVILDLWKIMFHQQKVECSPTSDNKCRAKKKRRRNAVRMNNEVKCPNSLCALNFPFASGRRHIEFCWKISHYKWFGRNAIDKTNAQLVAASSLHGTDNDASSPVLRWPIRKSFARLDTEIEFNLHRNELRIKS